MRPSTAATAASGAADTWREGGEAAAWRVLHRRCYCPCCSL
jgi:hypothetical protein